MADEVETAILTALRDEDNGLDELERIARRAAGSTVADRTRRRPMIVPVVMET